MFRATIFYPSLFDDLLNFGKTSENPHCSLIVLARQAASHFLAGVLSINTFPPDPFARQAMYKIPASASKVVLTPLHQSSHNL